MVRTSAKLIKSGTVRKVIEGWEAQVRAQEVRNALSKEIEAMKDVKFSYPGWDTDLYSFQMNEDQDALAKVLDRMKRKQEMYEKDSEKDLIKDNDNDNDNELQREEKITTSDIQSVDQYTNKRENLKGNHNETDNIDNGFVPLLLNNENINQDHPSELIAKEPVTQSNTDEASSMSNNSPLILQRSNSLEESYFHFSNAEIVDDLKSLTLSYPGWEVDVKMANIEYLEFSSYNKKLAIRKLERAMGAFVRKQNLHEGDRSNPSIEELDSFASKLTYVGHEHGIQQMEKLYVTNDDVIVFEENMKALKIIEEKYGSNKNMVRVKNPSKNMHLSYDGWEQDISRLQNYEKQGSEFYCKLQLDQMRTKQKLHIRQSLKPVLTQVLEKSAIRKYSSNKNPG